MWAVLEVAILILEVLCLLPRTPKALQGPNPQTSKAARRSTSRLPDWVRWPIYGLIALAILFLVFVGIVLLFV